MTQMELILAIDGQEIKINAKRLLASKRKYNEVAVINQYGTILSSVVPER